MRTILVFIFAYSFLSGCSSSKNVISDTHAIHNLVASKQIEFIATSANPTVTQSLNAVANSGLIPPGSTISRIDLMGTGNYLKIFGDSVSANLPYYGERQFGGGYGAAPGIEFNGLPENYTQTFISDKQKYAISFQVSHKSDRYIVYIDIYPNTSSVVSINMANRNAIQYNGNVKAIKEDE
ncbi:uncharacterized protein DUF4251 [Maribacter spongiicola]|uniref:Uncharacterized protein DUF4251 n=1 Tax=Maribacter spongiicola TaxID=1206753 RepID=A0A4R7K5K7_9FLAO|nr:DUF4251 domain-containing protein [Maribacter spongiicola]TDT45363.1 uncharacterized protein DUF4251 [Maribacter spongiicola]